MRIKYYFPLSVAIFAFVAGLAHHFVVPVAPFAVVLLAGETLLGFQLEDHKAARVVGEFLKPFKTSQQAN